MRENIFTKTLTELEKCYWGIYWIIWIAEESCMKTGASKENGLRKNIIESNCLEVDIG